MIDSSRGIILQEIASEGIAIQAKTIQATLKQKSRDLEFLSSWITKAIIKENLGDL